MSHHADPAQIDDCVLHGHLKALALACLFALHEGGQNTNRAVNTGARIANRWAGPERRGVWRAGNAHRSTRCLGDHVKAFES